MVSIKLIRPGCTGRGTLSDPGTRGRPIWRLHSSVLKRKSARCAISITPSTVSQVITRHLATSCSRHHPGRWPLKLGTPAVTNKVRRHFPPIRQQHAKIQRLSLPLGARRDSSQDARTSGAGRARGRILEAARLVPALATLIPQDAVPVQEKRGREQRQRSEGLFPPSPYMGVMSRPIAGGRRRHISRNSACPLRNPPVHRNT